MELDRSLFPILAETLADRPNAEICPGDILKTDIPALVGKKSRADLWPAPTYPITSPPPPSPPCWRPNASPPSP
ncbi:MAG: hypothetical protein ACLT3D_12005 [Lawsonibacter sp.]